MYEQQKKTPNDWFAFCNIVDELVKQGDVVTEIVENLANDNFAAKMTSVHEFQGWQKIIQLATLDQDMGATNENNEHENENENENENEIEKDSDDVDDVDVQTWLQYLCIVCVCCFMWYYVHVWL